MHFWGDGDVLDLELLMAAIRFLYTIFMAIKKGFSRAGVLVKLENLDTPGKNKTKKRVRPLRRTLSRGLIDRLVNGRLQTEYNRPDY